MEDIASGPMPKNNEIGNLIQKESREEVRSIAFLQDQIHILRTNQVE